MTKKLSITMSEEFYNRLEKVRNMFNISEICRKALEREIEIEELSLKVDEESVIERLKLEKSKNSLNSEQEGKKCGIGCAKEMSYLQLKAFYSYNDDLDRGVVEEEDNWRDEINSMLSELPDEEKHFRFCGGVELVEFLYEKMMDVSYITKDADDFVRGFVNGVLSFYDKIKSKIEERDSDGDLYEQESEE